ncbi:polysaccharide pyruvyl transferase family protein [Enterococcus casseliflavus]|uniref:polysaccharide pyruvyl transferase family protein n=1 Tax=Enterococcus casseliflavus TaxID=37734 RepID=UPI000763E6B0|nr:polysaccharide pyruvyl transferase family protein [Enterococcus casseliflavus]OJG28872.1 YveS [Enterococcus casseliflavus]QQU22702.1 polysaccharide pyruvyl transferase family protein [Enterococcus casseliflavus]STQ30492.1 YveS [Enterococcus casseliflavus]
MSKRIPIIEEIKKRLPLGLKLKLIQMIVKKQLKNSDKLDIKLSSKPRIFLMLATDYPNLGDHALTIAHKEFLEKNFPLYEVMEFYVDETIMAINTLKEVIQPNDIITLKGGGNIGIEYFREELLRRNIIKNFPNNKIVLFPQTVYFPDTNLGSKEKANTINVLKRHKNIRILVRDQKSYDIMKGYDFKYLNLVPDIVFSYKSNIFNENKIENKKILFCLRNDREKAQDRLNLDEMDNHLKKNGFKTSYTDTVLSYNVDKNNRYFELEKKLKEISSSKIVVTDRLHGMIFCYITRTPCIVLETYNHKVTGQFEWISDCNFITFTSNLNNFVQEIDRLAKLQVNNSLNKKLDDSLATIIYELEN